MSWTRLHKSDNEALLLLLPSASTGLGAPPSPTVDEAHCLWPLCSHSHCWEAQRRIQEGRPRKVKAKAPRGAFALGSEEDRFPAITLVNASEWPDSGSGRDFPLHKEDDFSEAASNTLIRGPRRRENLHIPKRSSAMPTHLETHRDNRTVKLKTVDASPLPSSTSTPQSSVMWVPRSCRLPGHNSQHSAPPHTNHHKSPRLTVKELILLSSAEMNKSVEYEKKPEQDKSRKRALLKPSALQSHLNWEGKGSLSGADTDLSGPGLCWPASDSDRQAKKATAPPQVHRLVPVGQMLAAAPDGQQPPRSAQTIQLRNKLMVFEETEEAHPKGAPKLDLKKHLRRRA